MLKYPLFFIKNIKIFKIGPEKGVTHLAVAAIINGLWDLWAKLENVPVWRLLTDMEPQVSVYSFFFYYLQINKTTIEI